jgi:hypothetical protein
VPLPQTEDASSKTRLWQFAQAASVAPRRAARVPRRFTAYASVLRVAEMTTKKNLRFFEKA